MSSIPDILEKAFANHRASYYASDDLHVIQICITFDAMSTTVRLDPETEKLLRHLSKSRKKTKSEIIRQAIRTLAAAENKAAVSIYEAITPYLGVADSGGLNQSEESHKKFANDLKRKRHGSR